MGLFSGPGVTPSLKGLTSNVGALAPGQTRLLRSAGWYMVGLSKYSSYQQYDPITQIWRSIGGGDPFSGVEYVYSDGQNYRFANLTNCAVGAYLTAAGSGYSTAPTVTASAGNSIWRAVVGGAVSTTVTVSNGGTGYTYAPTVRIAAPPPGGVQATGYAVLTAGVVTGITIVDQGAGYVTPPTIDIVNDPREVANPNLSTGYGATAVATLVGAGTVTALLCIDHGSPVSTGSNTVPTLTFAGGGGTGATATAIMCWTIQSVTVTTVGAGLSGTAARVTAEDAVPPATAYVNPTTQSNLVEGRSADVRVSVSAGALTAGSTTTMDGGIYAGVPIPLIIASASVVTTAPVVSLTMGGITDTIELTPV